GWNAVRHGRHRSRGRRMIRGPAQFTRGWGRTRRNSSRGRRSDLLDDAVHVGKRVYRLAAQPDLKMAVGARSAAGFANVGDLLARMHTLAHAHEVLAVVGVTRHIAVTVIDLDHVAVAAAFTAPTHDTIGNRADCAADRGVEIQSHVMFYAAVDRIG